MMMNSKSSLDKLLTALQERAKELGCLYQVEEILSSQDTPLDEICGKLIHVIPPGWQYPEFCQARIFLEDKVYAPAGFVETPWSLKTDIKFQDSIIGRVEVFYTREMPQADEGPFLKEEGKLIRTIAERLSHRVTHLRLKEIVGSFATAKADVSGKRQSEWQVALKMLIQTDNNLYQKISRKMLNHLCWSGVREAEQLLQSLNSPEKNIESEFISELNQPLQWSQINLMADISVETFRIAAENLTDKEIFKLIQRWIQEDKLSFLVQVVNRNLSLADVADAIRRYYHLAAGDPDASSPNERGIQVSLIRRFLSDQLQYINVIKHYIEIKDFYHLLQNVIFTSESHGRLGGKSAGLYMAAQVLRKNAHDNDLLDNVKVPKTWHITTDCLLHFMHHNNFEEVVEQKYKEINQVRLEYPHIVETFKRARFPADITRGLSVALDDFGDVPLIVRSSSLLEDRVGAAFSGKYKSLFLANQGSKKERLAALTDAIAEVYASTFSPDPIEYRAERGLLDFGEEMGIMIQEVVGTRVGKYYLPAFAGVAFSNNEFRWSPRIKREDGLIRLVPGLGTRAVDRLGDDYPVLLAPGQPNLRVNVDPEEIVKYSPKKIDVINLETNCFETIDVRDFMKIAGKDFPAIAQLVSVYKDSHISRPLAMSLDPEKDDLIVTFDGLVNRTPFIKQVYVILKTLQDVLGYPIDIEFASDGRFFYILQCRSQSYARESRPTPIPKDIPEKQIVFSARKYISNGRVPDITHIVYINSEAYGNLEERADMLAVGRAVSKLNVSLPKRQFILMGPGRWGSRGDIKLGVSVSYSDINNTAMLIEIARTKGNYTPDLSFGTHFFQDLVEADIRYLPLYPDDAGIHFNEIFLQKSPNILPDFLPDFAHLSETIRLIDVPRTTNGQVLKILLNAELEEALAILAPPSHSIEEVITTPQETVQPKDAFWRWRFKMVERIAANLNPKKFGVAGFYVFGSTKNATAGPASDIDILIHFRGNDEQRERLLIWLDGWSKSLAELNFMRTGYRSDGLLDVHLITDEDIINKDSYATKINAVTDAARPLLMGTGK